jgi:hypothetical protein
VVCRCWGDVGGALASQGDDGQDGEQCICGHGRGDFLLLPFVRARLAEGRAWAVDGRRTVRRRRARSGERMGSQRGAGMHCVAIVATSGLTCKQGV